MERHVVVGIVEGLHARPAALFVGEAAKQAVPVTVRKGENASVQAASILGIMTLGAAAGDTLVLSTETDGPEAVAALDALEAFLVQTEIA
jgi:phosphocarrier protein